MLLRTHGHCGIVGEGGGDLGLLEGRMGLQMVGGNLEF